MAQQNNIYMGVDIEAGSPLSRSGKPLYSVVVISDELKLVAKHQAVPLAGIIRLAWEHRPKAIASDNVMELSPSGTTDGLARLLSLLPPGTKLVQATSTDDGFVDVKEAAKRLGLDVGYSKLSPMRTAFIVAAIAAKGGGKEVGFSREKTYIVVSKGRFTKSGGWSQSRYQRRIRASVKIAADKVKEALDRANIDYDVFYRSSEGGIESAVFIVYAPREKLTGLIKPHRGIDYTVKVETKYEGELIFGSSDQSPPRPLIVGIDAGMTTGLAVLDLDGRVLHLGSYKEIDRGEVVSIVSKLGRPVIVSTDVSDPPELVRKLAAQMGAQLYLPDYNLSVAEKEELASRATEYSELKPSTPHERDSLAAAYKAFLDYHNKLSQVEAYVSKLDIDLDIDELKADVLRGLTLANALERQIGKLLGEPESETEKQQATQRSGEQGSPTECDRGEVELLEAQKAFLEKQLSELKERLYHEERELYLTKKLIKMEVLKDEEIRKLKDSLTSLEGRVDQVSKENERLNSYILELKKIIPMLAAGKVVLARRLPELRTASIKRSEDLLGPISSNEVVIVDNYNNFDRDAVTELERRGVKAVLLDEPRCSLGNALKDAGIAPLDKKAYHITAVDDMYFVESKAINDALRVLSSIRESRAVNERLAKMIEEYRKGRIK